MFSSVTMKNEIIVYAEQWMELDIPILSERVGLGKTSIAYFFKCEPNVSLHTLIHEYVHVYMHVCILNRHIHICMCLY